MLRALPFQTIGDIARHGMELHVYCSRCFATRRLDLEVNTALHGRADTNRCRMLSRSLAQGEVTVRFRTSPECNSRYLSGIRLRAGLSHPAQLRPRVTRLLAS